MPKIYIYGVLNNKNYAGRLVFIGKFLFKG